MKKLEALKIGGVQKEEKRKNTCVVGSKASYLLAIFFRTPFHLRFKHDF
jgi:hypothetical protein